ncbi:cell wall-binding repeat-containing protein [Kytococcus sedentarius]|uniref:cell wall-binding repeat-containing protein n=1 Tax=Kytococcus sedentarius TaxID=1276 RepID=UPI0035BC0B16
MKNTATRALTAASVVGLSLGMVPATVAATDSAAATQSASAEYIVMLEQPSSVRAAGGLDTTTGKARAQAFTTQAVEAYEAQGLKVTSTYTTLSGFAAELTPAQVKQLKADPTVASVTKNARMEVRDTQEQPPSWGLDRIDQQDLPLDDAFTYPTTGAGVTAYVIDTGIHPTHQEFSGRIQPGFDSTGETQDGLKDCHGHGTHVAGTAAGSMVGVAKGAAVVPVRAFTCEGESWMDDSLRGIDWVATNAEGPSVLNMSMGPTAPGEYPELDAAITRLQDAGVLTAMAAGNDRADACEYGPGNGPSGINVAASTADDSLVDLPEWGSNYGTCIDIVAPGNDIISAFPQADDAYASMGGTSMASPHVAGAAALYLEANPEAQPAEVKQAILDAAAVDKLSGLKGSPNLLLNIQNLVGGEEEPPANELQRWWGDDRYGTAADVASKFGEADTVYIASGQGFADAVTGGAAAASQVRSMPDGGDDSPILLTRRDSLPTETSTALQELGAKKVVLIGGTSAISADVEAELAAAGLTVERIDGADRYETSANVAKQFGQVDTLYVASGEESAYADALSGSALAGAENVPVLLTKPGEVDAVTKDAINTLAPTNIVVLGGTAAVTDAVYNELGATERLAGADRYATSVEIAKEFEGNEWSFFATGMDFPDALVGGAAAARVDSPLLLTRDNRLPSVVNEYVSANTTEKNVIIGGTAAVSQGVEDTLKGLLGIA